MGLLWDLKTDILSCLPHFPDVPDLWEIFHRLNRCCFDGELPSSLELTYIDEQSKDPGLTNVTAAGVLVIEINRPLHALLAEGNPGPNKWKELEETLLHELVHARLWLRTGSLGVSHGPAFRSQQKKVNQAAKQHGLDLRSTEKLKLKPDAQLLQKLRYGWFCSCGFSAEGRTVAKKPPSDFLKHYCKGGRERIIRDFRTGIDKRVSKLKFVKK